LLSFEETASTTALLFCPARVAGSGRTFNLNASRIPMAAQFGRRQAGLGGEEEGGFDGAGRVCEPFITCDFYFSRYYGPDVSEVPVGTERRSEGRKQFWKGRTRGEVDFGGA